MNLVMNTMLKPLSSMRGIVHSVSQGNLREKIEIQTKDEIGEMSTHFNSLIVDFGKHLKKIKEFSGIMNTSVQDLTVTSKEISTTSNQQAAAVKEIVSTMEDSNALSRSVQKKIKDVAGLSNRTKEDVKQGFLFIKQKKYINCSIDHYCQLKYVVMSRALYD